MDRQQVVEAVEAQGKEAAVPDLLTVDSVFDCVYLRKVYNSIGRVLRDQLVRDPLDNLAYEAALDWHLGSLSYKVKSGGYRASSQTIVRSAKKSGMTRPLAFLEIEDQIVLKAACDRLQPRLLRDFPDYVNFGRSNGHTPGPQERGDYESWFHVWIRNQTLITQYVFGTDGNKQIVEADISNFFPSISLRLLRNSIAAKANSDDRLLDLLFYLLHSTVNRAHYAVDYDIGLPMENSDASRILAHFFLEPVDSAFREKGANRMYVRWVDDIRIGVSSTQEGEKVLGELQLELEKRGLALNSSKSRVVDCSQAQTDMFPDENAYLDEVHSTAKKKGRVDLERLSKTITVFVDEGKTKRRGGWERVLRRFYTESRRARCSFLVGHAFGHLSQYPGSCDHIIKYLRSAIHEGSLLCEVFLFLKQGNLYEDVEIRLYELLLGWRIADNNAEELWKPALDHFFARDGWSTPRHEYTKGLISLLVFKFGDRSGLQEIARYFAGSEEKHFLRYAFVVLFATTDFKREAQRKVLASEDVSLRRLAGFVQDLTEDPQQYDPFVKTFCSTRHERPPLRWWLEPRSLPLFRLLRGTSYRDHGWGGLVQKAINSLGQSDGDLRDDYTIEWLERERSIS